MIMKSSLWNLFSTNPKYVTCFNLYIEISEQDCQRVFKPTQQKSPHRYSSRCPEEELEPRRICQWKDSLSWWQYQVYSDNMQCCSNKRVTVYLSNLFLCPTYNTCLHFSSIFFSRHWNLISFWSSGQSRVRVVHFGAFALPQFVSKTAWQISRPECFKNHPGWPDEQPTAVSWNCEICQNAKCLWTSEAAQPPMLPEDEDEIEVSSYWKDGVYTALTLKDQKRRWYTSMVSWRSRCFFFPEIEHTKKADALENDFSFKSGYFMYVKFHVCGTFGSFAEISQVPTFVGRLLVEKLRSPPSSWHQKAPPFFLVPGIPKGSEFSRDTFMKISSKKKTNI